MQIEEIILGCKTENKESQKELVLKYSALLYTVCRRYSTDNSDAKDILQDSFIEIFKSMKGYDPAKGGLENWMKQIVARTAIRRYRKMYMIRETYDKDTSYSQGYESNILDKMEIEELITLINSLPFKYKQIFNLYVFEEYSHQEIGEMLGLSESSSRSRLSRARKLLLEKLYLLYPKANLSNIKFGL